MKLGDKLGKTFTFGVRRERQDASRMQIQRLYNQLKSIAARSADDGGDFEAFKPELRVLQAQAAHAVARENLSANFKVFFDAAVENVLAGGNDALRQFISFFEVVAAYFFYHSRSRGER